MNETNERKIGVAIAIMILLLGNIYFGATYVSTRKALQAANTALAAQKRNEKVLAFTKLFIEKVLKAKTDVDFETRLKLENDVREIGDSEILTEWQQFTGSTSELEAQTAVKNLLGTLVDKIAP